MTVHSPKTLKIMSASAGSGKTYNLVRTYMRMILGDQREPIAFHTVLAMTFTNKAAAEMKDRIILALHQLAYPEDGKAEKYHREMVAYLRLDPFELSKRAQQVLSQVLHQYEQFAVLTIDKFNLRLIRSFARDLNINSDFQTSTNEQVVLGQLVDLLFDDINREHAENLTSLTLRYARENMEEGLRWDFKQALKDMALLLNREQNLDMIADLMQKDFSVGAYEVLKKRINSLRELVDQEALKLFNTASRYDLDSFPRKSTTGNALRKLTAGDTLDVDHPGYFSPALRENVEVNEGKNPFPDEVRSAMLHFIQVHEAHYESYQALNEFRKNFFNIAILQLIAKALDAFKKSDNVVLISEFNKLISELLRHEDAAYIYERIGNRYRYFLLDEFQDTSRLQWTNLIPLVHDSLASGQENLIVGDPKQSIYRFKNGLAEQFVALPGIYNPEQDPVLALKSAYFQQAGDIIALTENYRSKREIVAFNNLFFEHFRAQHPELLADFYKDIAQEAKGDAGGYVYLESFELTADESATESEEEDTGLHDLSFILRWVEEVIQAGYDPGDICLLGYKREHCNAWAEYLAQQGYKVVSTDSLLLGADDEVKLIIAYLQWRNNPVGESEARRFAEKWLHWSKRDVVADMRRYQKRIPWGAHEKLVFDQESFLLDLSLSGAGNGASPAQFFAPFENLYTLFTRFCQLIGMDELTNAYVHQLGDYIFQFDQHTGPDISLFLENYQQEGKNTPVQIPENSQAIKIMTGHKSKGLEFPVVMIPTLSWNIMSAYTRMLLQQDELFFYVQPSKKSKISVVREAYEREFHQAFLDKINLNYVVFTRPKDRLYVRNEQRKSSKEQSYDKYFHLLMQSLPGVSEVDGKLVYISGTPQAKTDIGDGRADADNYTPQTLGDKLWFPAISIQDRELLTDEAISTQQRFGKQLHTLLELCNTEADIAKRWKELLTKGLVELAFETELLDALRKIVNLPEYKNVFDQATRILREQSIVCAENESIRPDLLVLKPHETIVLDYKTGLPKPENQKQVARYVQVLTAMGYPNVKGILFYTGSLELVSVA